MAVFGMGGSVRSRRSARVAVYGEPGGRPGLLSSSSSRGASSSGGKLGPAAAAGPICGPMMAAACSSGFCEAALGSAGTSVHLLEKG